MGRRIRRDRLALIGEVTRYKEYIIIQDIVDFIRNSYFNSAF